MVNLSFRLLSLFIVALAATASLAHYVTGDQYCTPDICFSITLDNVRKTVTIGVRAPATIGWIGLGFGSQMVGPELNAMWMTSSVVCISRRIATAHALPPPLDNQTVLNLLEPSGGNGTGNPYLQNNQLAFSYRRPQVLPESTLDKTSADFIWAYGTKRPSSDCLGPFTQHQATGTFTLDLNKVPTKNPNVTTTGAATSTAPSTAPRIATGTATSTAAGTSPGSDPSGTSVPLSAPQSFSLRNQYNMRISHAVIMFCAWGVLIPLAIFIARFGKKMDHWVKQHWIIQVLAVLLTIVGFIIGVILSQPGPPTDAHQILGIAIFIAVLFQFVLGWFIHHRYEQERTRNNNQRDANSTPNNNQREARNTNQREEANSTRNNNRHNHNQLEADDMHNNQYDDQRDEHNRTRRPARNYMHIFFGITLLLLGYVQIPLGMRLFSLSSGWFYAYYIWLSIQVVAFLILTIRQISQRRREENGDADANDLTGNEEKSSDRSSQASQASMRSPETAYNPENRI